MNQQRLMKVILAPVVSEKSNLLAEKRNQMTFKVLPDATKAEVKAAVELLFGVQVASVTTVAIKGKVKNKYYGYCKNEADFCRPPRHGSRGCRGSA